MELLRCGLPRTGWSNGGCRRTTGGTDVCASCSTRSRIPRRSRWRPTSFQTRRNSCVFEVQRAPPAKSPAGGAGWASPAWFLPGSCAGKWNGVSPCAPLGARVDFSDAVGRGRRTLRGTNNSPRRKHDPRRERQHAPRAEKNVSGSASRQGRLRQGPLEEDRQAVLPGEHHPGRTAAAPSARCLPIFHGDPCVGPVTNAGEPFALISAFDVVVPRTSSAPATRRGLVLMFMPVLSTLSAP